MFRPLCIAAFLVALLPARAAEPHPSLPPPVIPDCLGVNIHFTDPRPGELEMLAAAGFKWVRMDFGWEATEKKKGEYDFSAYDRLVAALDQFKIRAVFILDYGNPLYADPGDVPYFTSRAHTPEFREAFGKWAVAAVSHFKGRGYLWDMWNEPNGGFWKSPDKTGDYIALAKSTGEALRKANLLGPKGEAFIGPATSLIDLPYLEACFKAGLLDYWDAVSVHPYRQQAPETVEDEYRSLRLLIRKYAPKDKVIPIISGEWGYSSAWTGMGKDDPARVEQQARYLPRAFLTNIANDVALSIWYDWHEDGTDPKEGEHHFGIVGNEYHEGRDPIYDPKPAYTAMKTLNEQLGGYGFNKRLSGYESGLHLIFTQGEQNRIVAWFGDRAAAVKSNEYAFLGEQAPPDAENDFSFGMEDRFDVFTYLGHHCPFPPGDERGRRIFDAAPHYFTPLNRDAIQKFQVAAAWVRVPLEIVTHVPSPLGTSSQIKNPLSFPLRLRLDATPPEASAPESKWAPKWTLAPGETKVVQFPYEVSSLSARGVDISYVLGVWFPNGTQMKFAQQSPIEKLNLLNAELLPPTDSTIAIRVSNPSGEVISGTSSFRVENDSVFPEAATLAFSLKTGQTESILQFPMPEAKDAKGVPVPIDDFFQGKLDMRLDGGGRAYFDVGIPIRVKNFSAGELSAGAEGDAQVLAEIAVTDRSPAQGAPVVEGSALKIHYHFEAGWKFCQLRFKKAPVPIAGHTNPERVGDLMSPNQPIKCGMWLHGDAKGCQTRIRFADDTGQTFQPDGPKIDWTGWRYVTFPMQSTDEKPLSHWGGANDGVIHYPIKWDSLFLLDNVSRQPVEGEIYLSAPTLIY